MSVLFYLCLFSSSKQTLGIMHNEIINIINLLVNIYKKLLKSNVLCSIIFTNPCQKYRGLLCTFVLLSPRHKNLSTKRQTERAVCVYGKKCIVWSPNSWQTGFRERISERRGVFCVPFFVDNKPVMGYTLLWRTNS